MTEVNFEVNGDRMIWFASNEIGGVHIWAQRNASNTGWTGGIEYHWRVPSNHLECSHKECWLLKAPCYHDGSSLQFSEGIAPFLPSSGELLDTGTHNYICAEVLSRLETLTEKL